MGGLVRKGGRRALPLGKRICPSEGLSQVLKREFGGGGAQAAPWSQGMCIGRMQGGSGGQLAGVRQATCARGGAGGSRWRRLPLLKRQACVLKIDPLSV